MYILGIQAKSTGGYPKKIAACSYYGINKDDIGTAQIDSGDKLKKYWNSMGHKDKITAVTINSHADNLGLFSLMEA